jgi:transcriptional regulator
MRIRPKQPPTPVDRHETLRREIISLLTEETMTARDISQRVGISEREVLDHLEHIKAALRDRLQVTPPVCIGCGFIFRKRERLKAPGKCPVCRSEHISKPSYTVVD